MRKVQKGDKVKVHYHGRLMNGETFDSSTGRDPLAFEVGAGQMIKGFDAGVVDMTVGEKKTVHIPFADAYGPKSPENIIEYPASQIPADFKTELGQMVQMGDPSGNMFQVKITAITPEYITLDANHPLAGEDLIFDIELVEIGSGLITL